MKHVQKICLIVMTLAVVGCGNKARYESNAEFAADTAIVDNSSSIAAVNDPNDTVHKFVRTAEMKFRVNDVVKSTYHIEKMAKQFGGFVTESQLSNNDINVVRVDVDKDSVLEKTYYTMYNNITFKVPTAKLDTTLREIARMVVFLDYRTIKAEDVSIRMKSNKMRSKLKVEKKIVQTEKGKTNTIVVSSGNDEEANDAIIDNLSLAEQLNYSTVQVHIYQRPSVSNSMVVKEKVQEDYKPGFFADAWESIVDGWAIVSAIIIFLIKIWGIILLGWLSYKGYTMYTNRKKK